MSDRRAILERLLPRAPRSLHSTRGKICWYMSAGIDRNVLRYFHGEGALVKNTSIFFFTDFLYGIQGNELNYPAGAIQPGGERIPDELGRGGSKEIVFNPGWDQAPALVESIQDMNSTWRRMWIIYIGIDNRVFEEKIAESGLKIDVFCDASGMRGPPPRDLTRLGVKYALAQDLDRNRAKDPPYKTKTLIHHVDWGVNRLSTFFQFVQD